MVPVHLDALFLAVDTPVRTAMADFSRLPYFDGGGDVNGDTANLSENIVSEPFDDEMLYLKPGAHLHWTLPDALTRGAHSSTGTIFPHAPNRWLITRTSGAAETGQSGSCKCWIVESDYLFPEGTGAASGSISYPVPPSLAQPYRFLGRNMDLEVWKQTPAQTPPAEYLPKLTAIGYGNPAFAAFYPGCRSVFGFYDQDFGADAKDSAVPTGIQYQVVGWHSDAASEPLAAIEVADSQARTALTPAQAPQGTLVRQGDTGALYEVVDPARLGTDAGYKTLGPQDVLDRLETRLGWKIAILEVADSQARTALTPAQAPQGTLVHQGDTGALYEVVDPARLGTDAGYQAASDIGSLRMLCYAQLAFDAPPPAASQAAATGTTQVAVANTGSEALSALLANLVYPPSPDAAQTASRAALEDQLEALSLSSQLAHRQLDLGPNFEEARHAKGFATAPGGSLWTVTSRNLRGANANANANANAGGDAGGDAGAANAPAASAQRQVTLPDQAADQLNTLNRLQQTFDRANQEIESMRRQLFADWYKYMLCAYPPEESRESYPNIDEARIFIEQKCLLPLQDKIAATGALEVGTDSAGNTYARVVVPAGQPTAPASLATGLTAALTALQTTLTALNASGPARQAQVAYALRPGLAPRYYKPANPVALLTGPDVILSARNGADGSASPDGLLTCHLLRNTAFSELAPATIDAALPQGVTPRQFIAAQIAALAGNGGDGGFAFSKWIGQPWNPFLLDWEVEVFPMAKEGNIDTLRYGEDFMTANYGLDVDQVDAAVSTDPTVEITSAANIYAGSSLLTPDASTRLKADIEDYVLDAYYRGKPVDAADRTPDDFAQNAAAIRDWVNALPAAPSANNNAGVLRNLLLAHDQLAPLTCLAQALGGFNEALLMRKQTLQLPIADPLGFDDYLAFSQAVAVAVGGKAATHAAQPLSDFNPIRSGAMTLRRLRLTDTFGQMRELDCGQVVTTEKLKFPKGAASIALPPRLSQPARLNFRWLSAANDDQEMNGHPASSPICGWLLPNNLDNSLMFYDGDGKSLGYIDQNAVWQPAPGSNPPLAASQIPDAHLRKVAHTLTTGPAFIADFISALDSGLENVEPENFAQHQDLALLMGRPIALVRASLNLELQGLPALHQGWEVFSQDLQRLGRDTNGFEHVGFPIRVGEFRQFNDGLIGFWRESGGGELLAPFYASQTDTPPGATFDARIQTRRDHPTPIIQSLAAPAQLLTLLIDPRGSVHATTGILPVKEISLPPDQYADALQAIEITFLSSPVLSDAGRLRLALPTEPGYQWSWLQKSSGGQWTEITDPGIVTRGAIADFPAADGLWNNLVSCGWITPLADDPTRAAIARRDKRTNPTPPGLSNDDLARVEGALDQARIGPLVPGTVFSGPQQIREGWLKLAAANLA